MTAAAAFVWATLSNYSAMAYRRSVFLPCRAGGDYVGTLLQASDSRRPDLHRLARAAGGGAGPAKLPALPFPCEKREQSRTHGMGVESSARPFPGALA